MAWMDRTAARWLLAAGAYAAWCTGTVWALLETTRPYPGIISMRPGRGAFELSDFFLHMPAWQALACLFLIAFALMALVGGLRRWLDPDRFAIDAVFWVLRSKSLWLASAVAVVLTIVGLAIPSNSSDVVAGIIQIAELIVMLLTPFAAWNAATLQRTGLSAWWRLCWPGWQAILLVFCVVAIDSIFQAAIFVLPRLVESAWSLVALNVVDEIVSFLGWLLVAIAWIERASTRRAWRSFLGFLRWRRLRGILWQSLLTAVLAVGVAVPVLMAAMLVIYVVPQYGEWAKSGAMPLSWPLHALIQVARRAEALWLLPAVIVMFQVSLAQGRLLTLLGAGHGGSHASH